MSDTLFTAENVDYVWNLAKIIPDKDPNKYRKDAFGNEIFYKSYGTNSKKGWVMDYIIALEDGGINDITNLHAVHIKHVIKNSGKFTVVRSMKQY